MFSSHTQQEREVNDPVPIYPSEFVATNFRIPDKSSGLIRNFSFEGMAYWEQIYNCSAAAILLQAGRQVAKSTMVGNMQLTSAVLVDNNQGLYVAPTEVQRSEYGKTRLDEQIYMSPYLRAHYDKTASAATYKKFLGTGSVIRLRNAFHNADRIRGLSADELVIDEIQDIIYNNIPVIEQVLFTSQRARRIYAGTPKSDENTLSHYWANRSTQCEWMVPCTRHSFVVWNISTEENLPKDPKDGLVCRTCKKPIDYRHSMAHWAAMEPHPRSKIPFAGFRIPQLISPFAKWNVILDQYQNDPRRKFFNEVLGLSYGAGDRPITRAEMQAACTPDTSMGSSAVARNRTWFTARKHMRTFVGVDWGCHDDQTEILTETGWVLFRELAVDAKVAQFDRTTKVMTFVVPHRHVDKEGSGHMLHFRSRGVDMMLTPGHRMLVRSQGKATHGEEPAAETASRGGAVYLPGAVVWEAPHVGFFELPAVPKGPGYPGCPARQFKMDDWMELLGYWLSEGGLCLRKSGRPYCIKMSQRETVNAEAALKIRSCLQRLGIDFQEYPNSKTGDVNWAICGKQFWLWWEQSIGRTSSTKRVPRQFLALGRPQLQILFDAMVLGDGSRDKRPGNWNGVYTSTSRGLVDDVQELCVKLGFRGSVAIHAAASGNRKARYLCNFSRGRDHCFKAVSKKVEWVPYVGRVYCCSVPDGCIVTRRNGLVAYQGNSGENSFSYAVVGGYYGGDDLRVAYTHRFVGEELEPANQTDVVEHIVNEYGCEKVVADYGGGMDRNDQLMRKLGAQMFFRLQYVNQRASLLWDSKLGRFLGKRTELMLMVFEALKRKQLILPRWEEVEEDLAKETLGITVEHNQRGETIYNRNPNVPDDGFHALVYMVVASVLSVPRRDFVLPVQKSELNSNPDVDGESWVRHPTNFETKKYG